MNIYGLQKMTLLDFPGHVACTVFLSGCDFRCPFCHNYELAENKAPAVMDEQELFAFLDKRKGLLDGVAITGGEPCLSRGLKDLITGIRERGFAVKLDTNGYHPQMLKELLHEGLVDYVPMDIKNSPEKYPQTCGVSRIDMDRIRESISLLMEGETAYEFRTTVVAEFHEADDFHRMGELISGARNYFLQRFTDRDTVPFGNLHAPSKEQLGQYAEIAKLYVRNTELRGVE